MISRQMIRAVPARALLLTLMLGTSQAQALEPTVLKPILAQVKALPVAPAMTEDDFLRRARVREVKLSPDGKTLAYLETEGATASLFLLDVASGARRKLASSLGRTDVYWSGDSATVFLDGGDALSIASVKDGAVRRVASIDRKQNQRLIGIDEIRGAALADEYDKAKKLYRFIRIAADGSREVLYEGERKLKDYLLDDKGALAFTIALDEQYHQIVLRKQDGKWVEATRCKRRRACTLVAASPDQARLTMISEHGDDRRQLVEIDLASQKVRIVHTDPVALSNLRNVTVSPVTGTVLFAWYDMPYRRNYGLTPEAKLAAEDIARAFPDTNITISASDAAAHWLLTERGARLNAERYWLYERSTRSFRQLLREERALGAAIPEQHLAQKIPLHYRASDGMLVHGYLSLPPGRDPATVPMLTMVHGGPWTLFDNGYQTLVQLLVNRGVAVFQPNFRASTGYGARYMLAPKADFGNGRVQADIIDGVRWLLAQGVGDAKRLAIMGNSFGGYSTLLGLTHTPDLFQFGMAVVPPPDFASTMELAARTVENVGDDDMPFSVVLDEMGLSVKDPKIAAQMRAGAPAAHPGNVTKPLIMLAGARDEKVEIASVTAYAERLQALGKPVSLFVDPDEGHNLRKQIAHKAYVHLLEQMLHQHLGMSAPPPASQELLAYLEKTKKMNGALR